MCRREGNMTAGGIAMPVEVLAVSQTLSMPRSFTRGNREILEVLGGPTPSGRVEQGQPRTTTMHASRKSDEGVVPSNRRRPTGRGMGEGRPETSGNPDWPTMSEKLSGKVRKCLLLIVRAHETISGMTFQSAPGAGFPGFSPPLLVADARAFTRPNGCSRRCSTSW